MWNNYEVHAGISRARMRKTKCHATPELSCCLFACPSLSTPERSADNSWTHAAVALTASCTRLNTRRPEHAVNTAGSLWSALQEPTGSVEMHRIQGGSNMTGTNCDLFTHNQSRSYLNHLVYSLKPAESTPNIHKRCAGFTERFLL